MLKYILLCRSNKYNHKRIPSSFAKSKILTPVKFGKLKGRSSRRLEGIEPYLNVVIFPINIKSFYLMEKKFLFKLDISLQFISISTSQTAKPIAVLLIKASFAIIILGLTPVIVLTIDNKGVCTLN